MGRKKRAVLEEEGNGLDSEEIEEDDGNASGGLGAVSIAILTDHYDGDAVKAERVMQEIGEAGGYGRANESSVFAVAGNKQMQSIITKGK